MPDQNYQISGQEVRGGMSQLQLAYDQQQFEIHLFLHRAWHDYSDYVTEHRHFGRIRWTGTPPEVQLPGENTDT